MQIKFLFLFLLSIYAVSSQSIWDYLHYDASGGFKDIVPTQDDSSDFVFLLLSNQGEMFYLDLAESLVSLVHAVNDLNYFADAVQTVGYAGETSTIFAAAASNLWSTRPSLGANNAWVQRGTNTASQISTIVPLITDGNILLYQGYQSGQVELYNPVTKSQFFSFYKVSTCGAVSRLYTTEVVRSGTSYIDYITSHTGGCILHYPGNTLTSTLVPTTISSGAISMNNMKSLFYRVDTRVFVISSGTITNDANPVVTIYPLGSTSAVYTYSAIPTSVYAITFAQSETGEDLVAFGTRGGTIHLFSMTKYIANNAVATAAMWTVITTSYTPLTLSPVHALTFSYLISDDQTSFSTKLIALRQNGMVEAYDFSTKDWILLGSQADWPRGSTSTTPVVPTAASLHIVRVDADQQGGSLIINYQGCLYSLYDYQWIRTDPSQMSSVYSVFYPAYSRTPSMKPNGTINNILSFNSLMRYVDIGTQLTLILSDSTSTTTLSLTVAGYTSNSQPTRTDLQSVIVILDQVQTTVSYVQLFNYNYNSKTFTWKQTTIFDTLTNLSSAEQI